MSDASVGVWSNYPHQSDGFTLKIEKTLLPPVYAQDLRTLWRRTRHIHVKGASADGPSVEIPMCQRDPDAKTFTGFMLLSLDGEGAGWGRGGLRTGPTCLQGLL